MRARLGSVGIAALVLLGLLIAAAAPADRNESRARAHSQGFISVGLNTACVVGDDAAVRCWGGNAFGALGIGSNRPALGDQPGELPAPAVPFGQPVRSISLGGEHACAVLEDATARCWGRNDSGQLGLGDIAHRGDQPGEVPAAPVPLGGAVLAVASGFRHSCALVDGGAVRCWGDNASGQLGLGDTTDRGTGPDQLPTPAVPLERPAVAVGAGFEHNCTLLDDGSVRCWGSNGLGQLGVGANDTRGNDPNELPTTPVPLARPAIALAVGAAHNCALLDDGGVSCWGNNQAGSLGIGTNQNQGDQPGELPAATVPLGQPAIAISAGNNHSCALLASATVTCWGSGSSGQLGTNDPGTRGDAPGEVPAPPVPLNGSVVAIASEESSNCAALVDGAVRCWGGNAGGQLGLGDTASRGDGASEMPTAPVPLARRMRRVADLSLSMSASDAAREVGQQVTLTYTVANGGPDVAGGIRVGIGLPGMTVDSATATHGVFDPVSETWRGIALDPGGVAILTVVATVRAPGALGPAGEIVAADALDPDSTPANGADEDDRTSGSIAATAPAAVPPPPPPPAKGAIDALTLKGRLARDRRTPYVFSVTGAVIATRTALAGACSGTVTVNVTKGKTRTTSANGKLKLSKKAGTCTYRATIKLPSKAKAGNYTATATFQGNAAVDGKTSKKLTLRAG